MASSLIFDLLARDRASDAFAKVGRAADESGKKVHGLNSAFGAVTAGSRGLHTTFGLLGRGAALAAGAAGLGGLIEGFKAVYSEAREAQKTGAQTNAVIKSTGGIAHVSATQVGNLATAISNKVGVDDEAIQSGANLLLTFTNIRNEAGKGNDVFNRATQTVTDMAASMNQGKVTTDGLKAASIQVGKALNDPLKGITALTKVGVTFDAGQKKQITTLIAHGHRLQAQKIILGELNKEFGGSAAAGTTAGQKLGVVFGNIEETIGTALLPTIDKLATWLAAKLPGALATATRWFNTGKTGVQALIGAFKDGDVTSGGFVGVMERVGVVVRNVSMWVEKYIVPSLLRFSGFVRGTVLPMLGQFAQWLGPILGRAFAAVGHWIMGTAVPALQRFGGFITGTVVPAAVKLWGFLAKNLGPTFSALGQLLVTRIFPALQGLWARFQQVWPTISRVLVFVAKLIGILLALVVIILGKVLPVLIRLAGPILTLLFAAIGKIIGVVAALVSGFIKAATVIVPAVARIVASIVRPFAVAGTWLVNSGRAVIGGLWNGMKAVWTSLTRWISGIGTGVRGYFAQAGGWLYEKGKAVLQGFWDGLTFVWHKITSWISGLTGWIKDHKGPPSLDRNLLVQAGKDIMGGFEKGLKHGGLKALGFVESVAGKVGGLVTGPVVSGSNVAIGQMLAARYGWTGSQWDALRTLWANESGWNNNAQNPTSSAYGIAQFLNSTWGAVGAQKTSDPVGQISAGLRYIQQSYGSPANALSQWLSRSPHWYGAGMAPTVFDRPTLIGVGERGAETVTVVPHGRGGGAGQQVVNVTVNVSGVVGDHRAVAKALAPALMVQIREQLRSVGRPGQLQP